jgi:hypothetical protein
MVTAWIGLAGAIFAALLSAGVAMRQGETNARLTVLGRELETEVHRRTALIDREFAAEDVVTRYREPLASAAFDLQSRIYNILRKDFVLKYRDTRPEDARLTTLFRLAQYFGWSEILRRDIQFLSFPTADATRHVARLQSDIAKRFATDADGHDLMIWRDEQRALGERMIVEQHGKVMCMGYAAFRAGADGTFTEWEERIRTQLSSDVARPRLVDIQHLLCELVETLDEQRVRYTEDLERA